MPLATATPVVHSYKNRWEVNAIHIWPQEPRVTIILFEMYDAEIVNRREIVIDGDGVQALMAGAPVGGTMYAAIKAAVATYLVASGIVPSDVQEVG